MKSKTIFPAALIILTLSGCSKLTLKQQAVYDSALLIAQRGDSYRFVNRIGNSSKDKLDIRYSGFYGVETVWTIAVEHPGELLFDIKSDVESGKFKGVLVSKTGGVTSLFEGSFSGLCSVPVEAGKYRFKIVGSASKGAVEVRPLSKAVESVKRSW